MCSVSTFMNCHVSECPVLVSGFPPIETTASLPPRPAHSHFRPGRAPGGSADWPRAPGPARAFAVVAERHVYPAADGAKLVHQRIRGPLRPRAELLHFQHEPPFVWRRLLGARAEQWAPLHGPFGRA